MKNMSSDTCFIPVALDDGIEEQRLIADSYSFVTECFFMAHRTIDLGYRVGVDRLIKQNIVSDLFLPHKVTVFNLAVALKFHFFNSY